VGGLSPLLADKTLRVWDLDSGRLIATFDCDAPASSTAFTAFNRVFAGDTVGRVYILSLENDREP
jgi:WD40 repeat protein